MLIDYNMREISIFSHLDVVGRILYKRAKNGLYTGSMLFISSEQADTR